MKSDFLLKGLSMPRSFTCCTMDGKESIFWATSDWSYEKFKELFTWAKTTDNFWKSTWIAEIEYGALFEDGTPINPTVLSIREK